MYRALFNNVLVHTNPEQAHSLAIQAIRAAGNFEPTRRALASSLGRTGGGVLSPRLLAFPRPFPGVLGLAAGMDKDAEAVLGLAALGFGFIEIGTVTAHAQPGNDRPRLWRHPDIEGLRNRMGFNNKGAQAAGENLKRLRKTPAGRAVVVGANIGKSKVTPLDRAAEDYRMGAREVVRWVDYLVINVSSPNTPGLRELQDVDALEPIVEAVRAESVAATGRDVPLLVKIAPDLSERQIEEIAGFVRRARLTGVTATNTTIDHELGEGGLSGAPLRAKSLEVVRHLRSALGLKPVIVASGGIFSPEHGKQFLEAGADLLQAFTAFVYEGASWPGRMNRALSRDAVVGHLRG